MDFWNWGRSGDARGARGNGRCRVFSGKASVYGLNKGRGDGSRQRLASGGRLNVGAHTAAMKPPVRLGSKVTVTNLRNGRRLVVTVNDRGPYVAGRVIDVTPAVARTLGIPGLAPVQVSYCAG
ncbi:MAG: hypothetical protein HC902_00055 [Calothrix sp. SM1_5_4]|nr:hypothetical protein [Calothrix sp. SM1_5_4]